MAIPYLMRGSNIIYLRNAFILPQTYDLRVNQTMIRTEDGKIKTYHIPSASSAGLRSLILGVYVKEITNGSTKAERTSNKDNNYDDLMDFIKLEDGCKFGKYSFNVITDDGTNWQSLRLISNPVKITKISGSKSNTLYLVELKLEMQ